MDNGKQQYPSPIDWKELNAILKKANGGDQKAIAQLRKFLDEHPHIWQRAGNLAVVAETAWIKMIANGDALTAESLRRQLAALKEKLMADSCTTIEKLLVDSIIACWLELNFLRSTDADSRQRSITQTGLLTKRLESAQKRFHTAMKDLVQLRKLMPNRSAIPNLRIFQGEQRQA